MLAEKFFLRLCSRPCEATFTTDERSPHSEHVAAHRDQSSRK